MTTSAAVVGDERVARPPDGRPLRRGYLDWLRGVAVLIMIEAHLVDSWTRFPDRETDAFAWAMTVGGMGAPLFLFLAGVAVSLSAGSKFRRTGDMKVASRAVARRGLEIFGLAFLFRLQAWALGWSSPYALLKVDILNIMGPSIVAAAMIWAVAADSRIRALIFAGATITWALVTPIVSALAVLPALPDPVEAYIRPVPYLSNFVFFPWTAFVFGGALAGGLLDASRTAAEERRRNVTLGIVGAAVAVVACAASFLPTWYSQSYFWTTSPAFFFLRLGILTAAVYAAYLWAVRPTRTSAWSPLEQLGRNSLFIYWIHVEMLYGLISRPIHKQLSLAQAAIALVVFWLFMFACSVLKDKVVEWWHRAQ